VCGGEEVTQKPAFAISGLVEWAVANNRLKQGEWYEIRIPFLKKDTKTITLNDDNVSVFRYDVKNDEYVFLGKLTVD